MAISKYRPNGKAHARTDPLRSQSAQGSDESLIPPDTIYGSGSRVEKGKRRLVNIARPSNNRTRVLPSSCHGIWTSFCEVFVCNPGISS